MGVTHMRRIAGLAVALGLVSAGFTAATASAATKLTLSEEGTALTAGQVVELVGSENVKIRSSVVTVECRGTLGGMLLEVLTNGQARDELRFEEGIGVLNGSEHCESGSSFGNLGLGFVVHGPLKLSGKGKATLPIGLDLQFESELNECHYEKTLKGTNTAGATRARLQVAFLDQSLKLDRALSNSAGCPKKIEFSLSLPSADGEEGPLEAQT
jgi:hypothetical protein